MRFGLTREQADLRDGTAGFVDKHASTAATRDAIELEDGFDRALWDRCARELGVQGLLLPARCGGADAGLVELAVVIEQFGRTLACPTLLVSAVAAQAILLSGDTTAADTWLPALASGESIATFALAGTTSIAARETAGGYVLDGVARIVSDPTIADVFVIRAESDGRDEMFLVSGDSEGMTCEPRPSLDPTRRVGDVTFTTCPAVRLNCADPGETMSQTLALAMVMLAAEQLGGAQACLDGAARYAQDRIAFGQPIGAFQAVKHRCADMYLAVESARCAVLHAAWALDSQAKHAGQTAALVQTYCSDVYVSVAQSSIQVHGGIGFTWEHDVHLFLKRARVDTHMFGLGLVREDIALAGLQL